MHKLIVTLSVSRVFLNAPKHCRVNRKQNSENVLQANFSTMCLKEEKQNLKKLSVIHFSSLNSPKVYNGKEEKKWKNEESFFESNDLSFALKFRVSHSNCHPRLPFFLSSFMTEFIEIPLYNKFSCYYNIDVSADIFTFYFYSNVE